MHRSISHLHNALWMEYGDLQWWPAKTPFEVAVGAILTQNTSWNNVEVAIEALRTEGALSPSDLAKIDVSRLEALIRPSGFFRQKARYLKELATYVERQWSGNTLGISCESVDCVRNQLMALRGVGPETADSILLYALRMPSFVVDAYTYRLLRRTGIYTGGSYNSIKTAFEMALNHDVDELANAHAMIVVHCKKICRKKPLCDVCMLLNVCSEAEEQEERIADESR